MTTTRRRVRRLASAASVAGACAATYVAVATGRATVDLGVGRRSASLGPLTVDVRAPRELVFEVISAPYLGRAGPAGGHIEVVSRGSDLVVAAHRTPLAGRIVATTVEAVGFDRPREVTFRLLRGPVPSMQERFLLEETEEGTRVRYEGEMETDLWFVGALWGAAVRRVWTRTVAASLEDVRERSERRAEARRRREAVPS